LVHEVPVMDLSSTDDPNLKLLNTALRVLSFDNNTLFLLPRVLGSAAGNYFPECPSEQVLCLSPHIFF
jgi:hypothetical protein